MTCITVRYSIQRQLCFRQRWRWRKHWEAPGANCSPQRSRDTKVGIRVGEFLGRTHYKVFHTTGTAGTIAAAATTGRLLKSDARMQHAFGSAGTQAAGLWEFLRDAAD